MVLVQPTPPALRNCVLVTLGASLCFLPTLLSFGAFFPGPNVTLLCVLPLATRSLFTLALCIAWTACDHRPRRFVRLAAHTSLSTLQTSLAVPVAEPNTHREREGRVRETHIPGPTDTIATRSAGRHTACTRGERHDTTRHGTTRRNTPPCPTYRPDHANCCHPSR